MRMTKTFIAMETEVRGRASELAAGSSQAAVTTSTEAGGTKRTTEELGQQSSKKQKLDELSQEELQQLMIIVPEEMMNIEALDNLIKLWSLVQERFNTTEPTKDKEREIWVKLKILFEPDADDELWKLLNYMHDTLTWRLYDTCGVHHVSTEKGMDIFMLVEKEYPLSRGVLTLMLVNKLLVDQPSEMENELLR
ncbi:hypothetical protein Tco_1188921 [Tanacetum coccineum]